MSGVIISEGMPLILEGPCLIYVVVWGWDRLLRKTIKESVFLVSIIGGILSIIESALDLEGLHILRIPEVLRYVVLGATAFLVVVKIREWAESHREYVFVRFVAAALSKAAELQSLSSTNEDEGAVKSAQARFVYSVLVDSRKVFNCKNLRFQIMLQGHDLSLQTQNSDPPGNYLATDYRPQPGEGAAGLAFKTCETVYVPVIRLRQGIRKGSEGYSLAKDVFQPSGQGDPFKCLLCVPIIAGGATCGVLNVVCDKSNGFRESHFDVGEVVAKCLAFAVDSKSKKMILPRREG